MLKFFRKIRQQYLSENQFSKYLLYAAGEILLVMIGILLALQVNNWNQTKSEKLIAQDYLNNLLIELQSDVNYYQQLKVRVAKTVRQVDELLLGMNSTKENYQQEQLIMSLMEIMKSFQFTPKTATYTDMVTSGKMGLIKPAELRQKIITHYNLLEEKTMHINREIDYNWNQLLPFFNNKGYFEWRNNPEFLIDTIKMRPKKYSSILDLDPSSADFKAVENNLFFKKAISTARKQNIDILLTSTNDLLKRINKK